MKQLLTTILTLLIGYHFSTAQTALNAYVNSQTNILCNSDCTGKSAVTATGGVPPYSYSWAPSGGTDSSATGLCAGTYTCTITDFAQSSVSKIVYIQESESTPAITVSLVSQTNISCNGGSNGTIALTATGGSGTIQYYWPQTGSTTSTISGLTAGTYSCTVSSSANCVRNPTFTITEPDVIGSSFSSSTNASCNGEHDGAATINVTGGTGAYTYLWTPGGNTSANATGLSAGTYTCTVADSNNCSHVDSISITEPALITSSHAITLCSGQSISIGSNTYSSPGNYIDTLQAMNSCDSIITTLLSVDTIELSTQLNGLTITANNDSATSYQWIDCNNADSVLSGETAQSYTATANGSYAVIISNGTCSDTSDCVTIITLNTTAQDYPLLSIYPNPNNGIFTVESSAAVQIIVTNSLGQEVLNVKQTASREKFNIQNQQSGIYIVKVIGNGKQQVFKLLMY